MEFPTVLVFAKNVFLLAQIKKVLKKKHHAVEVGSFPEAKERIHDSCIDLVLIDGTGFAKEGKQLISWIYQEYGALQVPILIVDPPVARKAKDPFIRSMIAEYIYDPYDLEEWEWKLQIALGIRNWHHSCSATSRSKNETILPKNFSSKILANLAKKAKTFTLLIQLQPIKEKKDAPQALLIKEKLTKEIRKNSDKNAIFLPGNRHHCRVILPESSYEKAAYLAAKLLVQIKHPLNFSIVKSGATEEKNQERFFRIIEKILGN